MSEDNDRGLPRLDPEADEPEVHPNVEVVDDFLLELIGDVTKLGVLLAEIPEEQLAPVLGRYGAFREAVEGLPVTITPNHWSRTPAGEA